MIHQSITPLWDAIVCRSPTTAAHVADIVANMTDAQLANTVDVALQLAEADRKVLYEALSLYRVERALDAIHARLVDDMIAGSVRASDLLRVFGNHAEMSRCVITVAADQMQGDREAAALDRRRDADGIDARELEALLADVPCCALVLGDVDLESKGEEYSSGFLIVRIHDQESALDSSSSSAAARRRRFETLPGGDNTGRWLRFYLEHPRTWILSNGATELSARFLVVPFPAACSGGDNECTPHRPDDWIGGAYCADDDFEDHSDNEDDDQGFHEEVNVYTCLADVCKDVCASFVDLVVSRDGTVVHRSNRMADFDIDECIIVGCC